jgi:photosystem II stability/assembly factor-like uncharacterized protein
MVEAHTVLAVASLGDHAFLATQSGLYQRTISNGASRLIDGTAVTAIAISGSTIVAGGLGGFLVSRDAGGSWTYANTDTPPPLITCIAFAGERTMLAGTFEDGVLRSDDGGQIWEHSSAGLFDFGVLSIATVPDSDLVILGTETGAYLSTSGGRFWKDIPALDACSPATIATMSTDGSITIGSERGDIMLSRDRGMRWEHIDSITTLSDPVALAIVAAPSGRDVVMVVTPDGVFDVVRETSLWQESTVAAASCGDGRLTIATDDGSVRTISLSGL